MNSSQQLFDKLKIDLEIVPIEQLAEYTAVEYFLTAQDESLSDADNLKKITHYLESFHHLCEAEDWQRASLIMFENSITPNSVELHQQLRMWSYYEMALDVSKRILDNLENERQKFSLISTLGSVYDSLGQYDLAVKYHQILLDAGPQHNNPEWTVIGLNHIAYAYHSSDLRKAMEYHQQALMIAIEHNLTHIIPTISTGLGNMYCYMGQYVEAINCFERSLEIAQATNNRQSEASALSGMGHYYRAKQQYDIAIQFYEKEKIIVSELGYRSAEAGIYNHLGVCYKNKRDYKKAVQLQIKSAAISKEIGDKLGEATVLGNLGVSYFRLKQYEIAINYQFSAIKLCQEIGDTFGEARAYNNLANVYYSLNDSYQENLYLIKSLWLFDSLGVNHQVQILLEDYFHELKIQFNSQLTNTQKVNLIYKNYGKQLEELANEYGKEASDRVVDLLAAQY